MIRAPSSLSSTLSPLAPPFTVDRLQPYRYPHPSTPPVAEFNGDGSKNSLSSWVDPSISYNASPFNKDAAQSSAAYGDAYGTWYGKHVDSSPRVHIGADSAAVHDKNPVIYMGKGMDSCDKGLSCFPLPKPNHAIGECDTSNSSPSYDRYMSQLVSCSPDPVVYYPSNTCSSSAPRNGYSTAQSENLLYRIDNNYVDCMLRNKEEPVHQYSDGKEGNVKGSVIDNRIEGNNRVWNVPKARACSSLENEVKTDNSMDSSAELKYGFSAKWLNFADPVASSSRPGGTFQPSSDMLDQPNLSVDSPCWKGAYMPQKYSFSGDEMIDRHDEAKESNGSDDLDGGQKCLPVTAPYLRTSPYEEKDGSLVCHHSLKFSSPISGNLSPYISLYETENQFHYPNEKGSERTEEGEEKRCHISCVFSEKSNDVKSSENDSGQVKLNVKQSDQERTASWSSSVPSPVLEVEGSHPEAIRSKATQDGSFDLKLTADDHVRNFSLPGFVLGETGKPINSVDPSSKYLTAGNDIRLIVKAMHELSEVLLSSSYNGVLDWMECDDELVRLVIGNLETFTSRSKTGNTPGRYPVSKSNDTVKKQSNTSTQVSVKDLESPIFEKEEYNPQAAGLYKNLWIQAEAAMCSMKYELQLARLNLEMEKNFRHETEAQEPAQVMQSSRLNSMRCFDPPAFTTPLSFHSAPDPTGVPWPNKQNDAGKSSELLNPREQNTTEDHRVEPSVMARLQVLKGRYAKSNNIREREQPNCLDAEETYDLGFVESRIAHMLDEDGGSDAHHSALEVAPADIQHWVPSSPNPEISEYSCDVPLSQTLLASRDGKINPMRFIYG